MDCQSREADTTSSILDADILWFKIAHIEDMIVSQNVERKRFRTHVPADLTVNMIQRAINSSIESVILWDFQFHRDELVQIVIQLFIVKVWDRILLLKSEILNACEALDLEQAVIFPNSLDFNMVLSVSEVKAKLSSLSVVEFMSD